MEVRKEVLEFGLLPVSVLIPKFDNLIALTEFHYKLGKELESIDGRPGFVPIASVCKHLNVSSEVWQLLLNFLKSLSDKESVLCNHDETHVDLHTLSLFLVVQIYGKQANKRADCDLQPSSKKETSVARGRLPRILSTLSYPSFLRRHLYTLLNIVKDDPPDSPSPGWGLPKSPHSTGINSPPMDRYPSTAQSSATMMTAREVNRLGFLIRPVSKPFSPNGSPTTSNSALLKETEKKYDVSNDKTIASCLKCFKNSKDEEMEAGCLEIATSLKCAIRDTELDNSNSSSELSTRPSRISGMTKGTLVRGEDSFPDNQLIIRECQDSCIYALAPLDRAKVTACSDCIIVMGPTSGCVIVENCTRIKLVYACKSTFITACHESTLHLASNKQPVLFGDNRFLQLAPFNIDYEHLASHLEIAVLSVTPNLWDKPHILSLTKNSGQEEGLSHHHHYHHYSESSDGFYSTQEEDEQATEEEDEGKKVETSDLLEASSSMTSSLYLDFRRPHEGLLLPPDQLLPFTVPFKGGPGPLAGGAPSNSQVSWVNRLGSGLGNGPAFALSNEYKQGLMTKLRKISELQDSVAKATSDPNNRRDVQVVIQSYFKEWLLKTARIRQVYDLAKLEQQLISESKNENPDPSPLASSNMQQS